MKTLQNAGVIPLFPLYAIVWFVQGTTALDIPLEVLGHVNIEQLPTITEQSPTSEIAFPFDESFSIKCEAKGNPEPEFRWKKDGQDFHPDQDPRLITKENSGTFVINNNGNVTEFQGIYRCYASNKLGTAVSQDIEFIVPNIPKFPKEKIPPLIVEEGQSVVLQCNPPKGIPPLQIHWMTIGLQHIEQDERVSMGLNGDLYFSNALEKDSRSDYCCVAAFPRIRTIVQKTAMSVIVNRSNSILHRKPQLMSPPGGQSDIRLVKGDLLQMECIAEGLPTPKYKWVKVGDDLPTRSRKENHGKLLRIPKVNADDNGRYMCTAENSLGKTEHYFTVTVEEPPQWEIKPESQLYMIGSEVTIKCTATGKPQPSIIWTENGLPLRDAPGSNRKIFSDTILIHNAKANNSAVYQCIASNKHGTILANANIMVMNLPPMILTKDEQKYAAVVGKSVVMDCKVFSSPPSTISWTKDDTVDSVDGPRFFVYENGSLEIHNVEKDDTGQYTCITTNPEGKSAITSTLDVKDATKIMELPEDIKVVRGSTAQLTCHAAFDISFKNDFQTQWKKGDLEMSVDNIKNTGYYVNNGVLQIINVSHEDQGIYTCIAITPLDQDEASAQLIVLDVPDPPVDLVLSEHKNRSVKLKWIPGDSHNSSITEFIVEYEESHWEPGKWKELLRVPGNHASAHLKLHGHLDYQFRVSAVNAIGRGLPSEPTERFKTPPAAPDKNPENIKIQGHLPNELDIYWEPLMPIEHNAPGLEYRISYRQQGSEEEWTEQILKRHSFVVKKTPTFVPYEIKIQAKNQHGWGPEPKVITGYSGEDFPAAAPEDVNVEVENSTLIKVKWSRIPKEKIQGHLGGYRVNWWRMKSLLETKKSHGEKHSLTFTGDRNHGMVPGLKPFSEYSLIVMAFNGRGNGPGSLPVMFSTPEGVPEQTPIFKATNPKQNSITLIWAPPLESNGILMGYIFQYQLINDTNDLGNLHTVNISNPETAIWVAQDLEPHSKYKFYLSACTRVGCGKPITEEGTTIMDAHFTTVPAADVNFRQPTTLSIPSTTLSPVANATLSSIVPALLNISSSASDTFAKISWIPGSGQKDSEFYVAYINNRKGNWKISEAVNISQNFHIIEGLEPGSEYTVRLMTKNWVDNTSIFEDVIATRGKGYAGIYGGISTQGWFIGLMCAVALLTLIMLIACFVKRNKGGKYSVKEKEDLHPDLESQVMNDDTFCEYSDNDEKPLKGSLQSLNAEIKAAESGDSLVDYGDDEHGQFNEDGSFIGEYTGHKDRGSMEVKGTHQITA
ncbi:neural cell adhesion molecule L1-like protein isoform X4 [Amia ocellicauda]|uniref:neural cell adhesion molecule L1-like protein isoform X4 n=1 Tax=Amia ocellicauda TaxID=2972642 RepID=UPI003463892F